MNLMMLGSTGESASGPVLEIVASYAYMASGSQNHSENFSTFGYTAQENDLLIYASHVACTSNSTHRTMSLTSSGNALTEVADIFYNSADADSNLAVGWRVLDGTETQVSASAQTGLINASRGGVIFIVRNSDIATPMDVSVTTATGSGGTANPAAITPVSDYTLLITVGGFAITPASNSGTRVPQNNGDYSTFEQAANDYAFADGALWGGAVQLEDTSEFDPNTISTSPGIGGSSSWNSWTATTLAIRPAS